MPNISVKERKPLSDLGQGNQSPVKDDSQTVEKSSVKDVDESANSSCVYSPMSVDHDTSRSMTAHRFSCDIDTYTSEFYSYLRSVEVLKQYYFYPVVNIY